MFEKFMQLLEQNKIKWTSSEFKKGTVGFVDEYTIKIVYYHSGPYADGGDGIEIWHGEEMLYSKSLTTTETDKVKANIQKTGDKKKRFMEL